MNGMAIFFCGGIFLCCLLMVAWLVFDARQRTAKPSEALPNKEDTEKPDSSEDNSSKRRCTIGKSTFEIDKLEEMMAQVARETVKAMLPGAVNEFMGDVDVKDVEFANEETEVSEKSNKFTPMSSREVSEAFDTDIRDVEDSDPSAPLASGASLDEIEDAVNTAINPDASETQQAKAGKILSEVKDTELFDRLTSANDDIDRRVNLCIKMSIKAEIEARNIMPRTARPKVVKKSVSVDIPLNDTDDFNLADLLP